MDGRSEDPRLTFRESLAVQFAGQFWLDHHGLEGPLWADLVTSFSPDEFIELAFYTAQCLAMGKLIAMLGLPNPDFASEPSDAGLASSPAEAQRRHE
jgi:hypothetical protein